MPLLHFLTRPEVRQRFEGKSVAVVGSGPGSLDNEIGYIDGHDLVVRVNNYRLFPQTGKRCDVFYSFFGNSIRKTAEELKRDGVTLCMCKCPNAKVIESEWHHKNGKEHGIDWRWIYQKRAGWWFCDVYIPQPHEFMFVFNLLDRHIPTTGFAAVLDVLSFSPASVYLTGFDFFASGKHNVTDAWREKNLDDPIRHRPDMEREWIKAHLNTFPITCDPALARVLA